MAQNNFILNLIAKLKINKSNINSTVKQATKQAQNVANKNKVNLNVNVNGSAIKSAQNYMRMLSNDTQEVNTTFGKLRNTISNTFSSGKVAMTSYLLVLNEINKAASNAKQTIKEIDSAITDLSIATNQNRESVGGLIKNYNAYAKELASTTTQITTAADDYLRAGKSLEESQALIKDSIMLSKLGKFDSSEATEDLLATMNGFNMSVDEVDRALDAMVAVDMKAATSAGDLATALKYSASSADMAGVSFNKLIAMIGTTQDKTQQSAQTIGTFMNTLLSRYRNVKIGQLVDDDGEDLSEVETVLKSLNIQLRDSSNEFRSFEVIIDEVATQWDSYSTVQQAAISKAFSGTRQQNRFIALMEGYNKVLELTEVAANSAGTAVEKFNNSYLDSLEAKENTLQASFESMVMNSDMDEVYSGIIEATTALVDFINKTNALKGVFSGLTLGVGIKAFMSLKTGMTEAYVSLNQFQQAMNLVKQTNISNNGFARLLMLSKNLSASQTKLILSSKNLTVTQKKQILMNQGLSASEAKLQLQNLGLTTSYTGLKASMVSATNALKALGTTMLANPLMLVATAISAATMAFQTYKQNIEEANERAKESAQTASTLVSDIEDLSNKYLELSKAIETDESAKDDLLSTQNELLEKLGLEGESVDSLITKYGSLSQAIRQASIDKLRDAQIDLISGLNVSENDMLSAGKGYEKVYDVTNRNIISSSGDNTVQAFEALEKHGLINRSAYGSMGGSFILTGDDTTVEGTLANYEKLQDALRILQSEFSATDLKDNDLFNALKSRADEMKDSVESYKTSLEAVNKGASQIVTLEALKDIEIPDTKKDFELFRKELIDTAVASGDFIGTEEEITKAIDAYLSTIPNFKGFFSIPIEEEINAVKSTIQGVSFNFETFEENLKSIESGYQSLANAMEEMEENGILSVSTITDLTESGLIQYLEMTKDGIIFNTQAFLDNSDAVKTNAIQQLYSAMAHDVQALAIGNVDEIATGVKSSLESAGLMAKESGDNALVASEDWFVLGTSVATTMTALGVDKNVSEDTRKQIEETISYYKNLANMVNDIDVTKTKDKNSSSKDIYLEEYKKKNSILEDELDKENITQKEFYEKSESLLNEYLKDSPKHIEKYSEEISSAEKKLHDVWNDSYAEQKEALDNALADGSINAHEYAIELEKLVNEYYVLNNATNEYGNYTKEAEQAQRDLAQAQKDAMNTAIDAVEMLYDKQIEKYEEAQEAFEKAQEEKIDAIDDEIKAYEKQVDSLDDLIEKKEKEIEALEDANEEREDALRLQKAQEALDSALNSRTKAKIIGGVVTYVQDETAIKDAKEELESIEHESAIKELEAQKELLETNKESIEKQIELLEKQKEVIEEAIEKSNEQYEKLTDALTKSKDRWSDLGALAENASKLDTLQSVLADMNLSLEDLDNMSDETFTTFREKYIENLKAMHSENDQFNEAVDKMAAFDSTNTVDNISQIESALDKTQEAAQKASESITGSSSGSDEEKSNSNQKTSEGSSGSLTGAIEKSANVASENIPAMTSMMNQFDTAVTNATEDINSLVSAIENLPDKKTITIETTSSGSSKSTGGLGGGSRAHVEMYAKGAEKIDKDQMGWTSENYEDEVIVSPVRGAIYTPLRAGDSVLTHAMSQNMWDWAKIQPTNLYNGLEELAKKMNTVPTYINTVSNSVPSEVNFNISMPNVTDNTAAEKLANDLKSIAVQKFQFFNKR